jgi:hypothetical protein
MAGKEVAQMVVALRQEAVIINLKTIIHMQQNKRGNLNDDSIGQGPNTDRSSEEANEVVRGNVGNQKGSGDLSGASGLDEKSSGMGRRDKGTGLATKDGLTGSDFDGQMTE